ncbi:phosphoglycerate mutase [Frankia sp. R43]|uniref:histidine phosphatase family protein n=1 Tax=unclassified Frankia TaxID=2632575 RepID=UPI0006D98A4C|nr:MULTISPECIES: histidine phosphatase family protein [unclassified Frankia]KPM53057.1 phosphoglycerate mutase [Frankia sp. R43]
MGQLVWLVRHGESTANAGQPGTDPDGIGLTDLGLRQADFVADAVPRDPSLIVVSGFLRAQLTAEPTTRRFPTTPQEIWEVHEFTYLGSLHGKPMSDRDRVPYASSYWLAANPYHVDRPEVGSESFAGLLDRADRLLARLRLAPPGLVVVFSHGMFIRAVDWCLRSRAGRVQRLDMGGYREHQQGNPVPNGSIIELHEDDKELRQPIDLIPHGSKR